MHPVRERTGYLDRSMAASIEIHTTPSVRREWLRSIISSVLASSALNETACAAPPAASPAANAATPVSLDYEDRSHRFRSLGRGLLDAAMLIIAFLAADLLRCLFWQDTPCPQRPLNVYQDWYWYLWVLPPLALIWPVLV